MKTYQSSSDAYADGMAIGVYNFHNDKVTYRWRDDYFTVPMRHPSEVAFINEIEIRITPVEGLRKLDTE